MRPRSSTVLAAVAACTLLTAVPAGANDPVGDVVGEIRDLYGGSALGTPGAGVNVVEVSSPQGRVTGACSYVTSLPSGSFQTLRILLHYTVTADRPAAGVGGRCEVVDGHGVVHGAVTAAAPGSHAEGTGYVDVPRDIQDPNTCATAYAIWLDGSVANAQGESRCLPF
jgi:hypothetical protein